MRALIDTIFAPILTMLTTIQENIQKLSVPFSHPLQISDYLGIFSMLGSQWMFFIQTVCALAFIYVVAFIVVAYHGLYIKTKDSVKWW